MDVITIPIKIKRELKEVTKITGIDQSSLLVNAVTYYLDSLKKNLDLKKELDVWEKASINDLLKLEKTL
jgi:hypothetical protein